MYGNQRTEDTSVKSKYSVTEYIIRGLIPCSELIDWFLLQSWTVFSLKYELFLYVYCEFILAFKAFNNITSYPVTRSLLTSHLSKPRCKRLRTVRPYCQSD